MKLEIKARVTLEGFTYQPGVYEVVKGNDAAAGQVTEKAATKLQADHPGVVVESKPAPPKVATVKRSKK